MNTSQRSKENEQKIDVHEGWSLNYWCDEFNLRADELKEIVRKVGPDITDIRGYLAKKLMDGWTAVY